MADQPIREPDLEPSQDAPRNEPATPDKPQASADYGPEAAPPVMAGLAPFAWEATHPNWRAGVDTRAWTPAKLRPSVQSIVAETFGRYAADFARITFVAAILVVPATVIAWLEPRAAILSGILQLVAFGALIAISGAGPGRTPVREALGVGVRRAGWVLIAEFVIGVYVGALGIVAIIAFLLLGGGGNQTALVLSGLALLLGFAWIYLRLGLAVPAVVLDGMTINPALTASRRLTKPASVLVRVAATFGLLIVIAGPVEGVIFLPLAAAVPEWLVLVGVCVVSIVTTPLFVIAHVVLYRRLSRDQSPSNPAAESWNLSEGRGRALVGLTALGSAAGVLIAVIGLGNLMSGVVPLSGDAVPRGEVHFGTGADLAGCRVDGEATVFETTDRIYYIASFRHTIRVADEVLGRVSVDGETAFEGAVTLAPGTDCGGAPRAV